MSFYEDMKKIYKQKVEDREKRDKEIINELFKKSLNALKEKIEEAALGGYSTAIVEITNNILYEHKYKEYLVSLFKSENNKFTFIADLHSLKVLFSFND